MTPEYIESLIADLYDSKDAIGTEANQAPVQDVIDLLDELLIAGSLYLDQE
jgi:hypothetical protein